ncbi:MAG: YcaO-like family protein [Acidobacteriota bacterium]
MPIPSRSSDPFASLVDERFGPIRSLRLLPHRHDLPSALRRAHAEVCDSSRFSAWHSDDRAGGFAWDSAAAARAAAAGEAIERYCGNLVPRTLRRASFAGLETVGESAVDPVSLALFSDAQYAQPGFPFVRFSRRLPVLWARGRGMLDGRSVWVPASLVWVTFAGGRPTRAEPKVHATPYAGVAAGPDRAWAETAALLELVERDALATAWQGGEPLPSLRVPAWLAAKVSAPELRFDFHRVPSAFGVPVVAALVHDLDRDLIALGVAARAEPTDAALKAAAEALQLLVTSRILDDPTSDYMRRVAAGAPGLGVKPWRRDRAYRRLYDERWRDVWDLLSHLQLYHDPTVRAPFVERLAHAPTLALDAIEPLRPGPQSTVRDELVQRLATHGHAPIALDLTTTDIAAAGFVVVRVVAPGLYGNAPAAFPYLGGPRLERARTNGRLELRPLPYA